MFNGVDSFANDLTFIMSRDYNGKFTIPKLFEFSLFNKKRKDGEE